MGSKEPFLYPGSLDLPDRATGGVEGEAIVRHQSMDQLSAVAGEKPPANLRGRSATTKARLAPCAPAPGRPPPLAKPALQLRIFHPPNLSYPQTGKLAPPKQSLNRGGGDTEQLGDFLRGVEPLGHLKLS